MRIGHFNVQNIQKVISLFQNHKESNLYDDLSLNSDHFQTAETIIKATESSLRSLDAIHLGIAFFENLTLFSNDNIMNEAAEALNIPTIEI